MVDYKIYFCYNYVGDVDMKKYFKILIIVLCVFVVSGCNNKKDDGDGERFKKEYDTLDISSDNIIKYSDIDKVLDILDSDSGVIYIGNSSDDLSKVIVPILLSASESTDLDKIYYVDSNKIEKEFSIDDKDGNVIISNNKLDIPLVMFIYDGSVIDYHIGSIDDKLELSEEETIELYNKYLDGIHGVLNDQCDTDNKGDEHC